MMLRETLSWTNESVFGIRKRYLAREIKFNANGDRSVSFY